MPKNQQDEEFEKETGISIGSKVRIVSQPEEGFLSVGDAGTVDFVTWDAGQWYVYLLEDQEAGYLVPELEVVDA